MRLLVILILVVISAFLSFAAFSSDKDAEILVVKKMVENCYVKGSHINLDSSLMKQGFHPDFKMIINMGDGKIKAWTLAEWMKAIDNLAKTDKKRPKVTFKIPLVDITDNTAVAKVKVSYDGKLIFTDYFLLYKFSDGWKIVSKICKQHN